MNKSKKLAFALVLSASLVATGALAYEEVAGAGPYSDSTPTPTATSLPTLRISPSVSSTPTTTPQVSPTAVNGGGFMDWLTNPANLMWLGLGALVIVVLAIYLSRRRKTQGPNSA